MKQLFLSIAFTLTLILTSCGPAAENRQAMHERAKVFQDSIANMIRISMAEAEAPSRGVMVPAPAATQVAIPAGASAPVPTVAPRK